VQVIDKHKKVQDSKFEKEINTLGSMVDGAITSVQDDFEEKYKKIDENINRDELKYITNYTHSFFKSLLIMYVDIRFIQLMCLL
jgi:hypothetical protein